MELTEEKYREHNNRCDGYCENCDDITKTGGVEPDAEAYECPECDQDTLCGVEQALIAGFIEIVDDDGEEQEEQIESEDEEDEDF